MKILHLSDLHYCAKDLKWVKRAMAAAIELARTEQIDAWVISGDSLDSTMPVHEPAIAEYANAIEMLGYIAPGVVLYGTLGHDHPGSLDFVRNIRGDYPVLLVDRPGQWILYTGSEHKVWWSVDKGGLGDQWTEDAPVLFSVMPSLNKALPAVMAEGPKAWVQRHMTEWAATNKVARDAGIPTVLVTHGTVTGCKTESNYAMVSPDHEFSVATLASCGAAATMLGHIHKHQYWMSGEMVGDRVPFQQTIAYAGSITRRVYGQHDPAGCLLWHVTSDGASFDFHELPSRRLIEIAFDGKPDLEQLAAATSDIDDDTSVRVRYDVGQEDAHSIDKRAIEQVLEAAGEIKIEGQVHAVQSVRAPGIGAGLTMREKMDTWLETAGMQASLEDLEQRWDTLMTNSDVESIVKQALVRAEQ